MALGQVAANATAQQPVPFGQVAANETTQQAAQANLALVLGEVRAKKDASSLRVMQERLLVWAEWACIGLTNLPPLHATA